jgi:hypothetical protein
MSAGSRRISFEINPSGVDTASRSCGLGDRVPAPATFVSTVKIRQAGFNGVQSRGKCLPLAEGSAGSSCAAASGLDRSAPLSKSYSTVFLRKTSTVSTSMTNAPS